MVGAFDLSALLPEAVDPERLLAFMARDKKARHDLTFVLDGPDGVEVVHGVDQGTWSLPLRRCDRRAPDRTS